MQRESPTRPTLASVAAHAGVSRSTASLAFSGSGPVSRATRDRVLAAAKHLNYAGPDPRGQSLRRGRSGIVGVVIEERVREVFRDPIKIAILDGISEGIASLGAGLLLLTDTGDAAVSIESAPVDAVVFMGFNPSLINSVAILGQRGIPMVAIEGDAGDTVPRVLLDNREGTRIAAQHLKDLGHTNVATVTLPLDARRSGGPLTPAAEAASISATASERLQGARDIFPSLGGVSVSASLIEQGVAAGRRILSDPSTRPSAVIAQSDLLAAGIIRAAEEAGLRVPEDLSVVGFDGVRVDGLTQYDLTTLVQPAHAKGRAASEMIIRLLNGEAPTTTWFTSEFHLGNTTASPSHQGPPHPALGKLQPLAS